MFKTVAFLSYNAIPGLKDGWHKNKKNGTKILVLPNSQNRLFMNEYNGTEGNQAVNNELIRLWTKLNKTTKEIDQIVLYVGTFGHEVAIRLASKFPAEKVTYVTCGCDIKNIKQLIKTVNHEKATIINCECHGIETMPRLCRNFSKTGKLE